MRTRSFARAWLVLVLMALSSSGGAGEEDGELNAYPWCSVPIEVTKLGSGAQCVRVKCHLDFSEMVKRLGVSGVVDEHSLRLYRVEGRDERAEAVQFECDPQPRARGAKKLADTPAGVSYLGEYRA